MASLQKSVEEQQFFGCQKAGGAMQPRTEDFVMSGRISSPRLHPRMTVAETRFFTVLEVRRMEQKWISPSFLGLAVSPHKVPIRLLRF